MCGIIGINIDDGDNLLKAIKTSPTDHILMLTKNGKGFRNHERIHGVKNHSIRNN